MIWMTRISGGRILHIRSRLLIDSSFAKPYTPPNAHFGQHNALLRSHGVVKVNGVPAMSSTVVMEGDRIDTGKNSSASLLLPGRMISAES